MMTETQARTFRAAYEAAVKRYAKMTKAALAREESALMADQGMERLYGKSSKDELLSSVLNLRGYTIEKQWEATHVIAHDTPWPDCEHCQRRAATWSLVAGVAEGAFAPTGTGWPS